MINRHRINAPTKVVADPAYSTECQFALEPSVTGLVALATEAGWDKQQVFYSLMCLAANRIDDRALVSTGVVLQ